MTDADRLRAQIPASTDPDRLEREARRAEQSSTRRESMKTDVMITTVRDDGTPFGFQVYVQDVAQKHVLRTFNPSGDPKVDATKVLCAAIIQQMIDLRDAPGAKPETKRAASIAITQCEALQMQAVKANFVQA